MKTALPGGSSVELLGVFGDDLLVANAARVSFNRTSAEFTDRDARLIRYLARHRHFTPFAQPQIRLRITAPIFVARQWFRHTVGVARNEVSRRYVDEEPAFWRPEVWRGRAEEKKQGSGEPLETRIGLAANRLLEHATEQALKCYQGLLSLGVCPEQARAVLPLASLTSWIETGSLAYYARVFGLRLAGDAQEETRRIAEAVRALIEPCFPVSVAALLENV